MTSMIDYEIRRAGALPGIAVSAQGVLVWSDQRSPLEDLLYPMWRFDMVVAHEQGRIRGVLTFTRRSRTSSGDVHVVWVQPRYRRQGIARQMLALLELRALRVEVITDDGCALFKERHALRQTVLDEREAWR